MKSRVIAIVFVLTFVVSVVAQDRHPGIVLYEQANYSEAIRSLEKASKSKEYKSDAEIWNYLGLAYFSSQQTKKSIKAFEKSAALDASRSVYRANLANAYLADRQLSRAIDAADEAIKLDPKNPAAYQVRSQANLLAGNLSRAESDAGDFLRLDPTDPLAYVTSSDVLLAIFAQRIGRGSKTSDNSEFLRNAVDVLEAGIKRARQTPHTAALEPKFELMSLLYKYFTRDRTPAGSPPRDASGVTPYRVRRKPHAPFTDEARSARVNGIIRAAVVLGADGKVGYVFLLTRLGYGLDENVIDAARKIEFEPKRVNGKPVPTVVTLEYSFATY